MANNKLGESKIYYHDIGDYLSKDEKLEILNDNKSITSNTIKFKQIKPNEQSDWINQRNDSFNSFIPILKDKQESNAFFNINNWTMWCVPIFFSFGRVIEDDACNEKYLLQESHGDCHPNVHPIMWLEPLIQMRWNISHAYRIL